jgi:hypothetical protein
MGGIKRVENARSNLLRIEESQVMTQQIMTLEGTFRHLYFEELTHLYNIQRLKRAQGLPTVVEIPRIGYWILEAWDRSEASSSTS